MPRRKALIILQASRVRLIFQARTFMEQHCPRKKDLKLSLTTRWPVPRGHSWSMLIWFMVSVHCLHRDDYLGSLQGPSDTLKVTVGDPALHTHIPVCKIWGFFFPNCRSRSSESLLYICSAEWNANQSSTHSPLTTQQTLAKGCVHGAWRGRGEG